MTPEEFIKWLDDGINEAEAQMNKENRKMEPNLTYYGAWVTLEEVKQKFLTITPPTTPQ